MTRHEKLIVSAYTGILMVDMKDFHEWVEEYLGYPVWTHEFSLLEFWEKLKQKTKDEFTELCKKEENNGND